MAVNLFKDELQHARLFGKPVLTTNWLIPRETVPDGWFCYDMRGTGSDPGTHAVLVDYTSYDHSGTVLSPAPLKRPTTKARRIGKGDYILHGETMDLEAFCEEYDLDVPDNPIKFEMRPASPDEAGLFYALPPEKDEEFGTVGHVRMDFGRDGDGFWHSWWPRGSEGLNTPEFKDELSQVVGRLRRGVLKDFSTMLRWCHLHGGEIAGGVCTQNYGYVVETERYRYCLRCNPVRGDYQAYLSCFDKRAQRMELAGQPPVGRVTFASGEQLEFTDPEEYLQTVREELPFHATTGFRFETLSSDPEIRKAADDAIYHLFGEENPRELEDYQKPPYQDMTLGGM